MTFGDWGLAPVARDEPDEADHELLRWLSVLHLLTTSQIGRLCFGQGRTPGAAKRAAQRRLARLHRLALVERLERCVGGPGGGSTELVWRLTASGAQVADPKAPAKARREPSLSRLAHVTEVAELVVRVHEHARTGACSVLEVQGEPECWRYFAGNNMYGRRRVLKPDLRLTLAVKPWQLHWFVEIDRATEHRPVLRRKITVYLDLLAGGSEQYLAGTFPRVLWVVPDRRRARLIEDLCATTQRVPAGLFLATTLTAAPTVLTLV